MKLILVFCCFSFICLTAISQKNVDVDKEEPRAGGATNYMYTVAGTPFVMAKFSRVVEGSPFFISEMMHGSIISSEGKEYRNVLIRLNLLETQVNYLSEKQIEFIASTPIREVVIWDTVS